MRAAVIALVLFASAAHADKIVPSGPLKAYNGPEGELVVMVEINDGKEMLVYFKNLDNTLDGKTLRYMLEVTRKLEDRLSQQEAGQQDVHARSC